LFLKSNEKQKFAAIFTTNLNYTKSIHCEVKEWVGANIDRWMAERRHITWFNVEAIPDEFLPDLTLEVLGGVHKRRRSSFIELAGMNNNGNGSNNNKRNRGLTKNIESLMESAAEAHVKRQNVERWTALAEEIYEAKR